MGPSLRVGDDVTHPRQAVTAARSVFYSARSDHHAAWREWKARWEDGTVTEDVRHRVHTAGIRLSEARTRYHRAIAELRLLRGESRLNGAGERDPSNGGDDDADEDRGCHHVVVSSGHLATHDESENEGEHIDER